MSDVNQNLNTGNKGTFPGNVQNVQNTQSTQVQQQPIIQHTGNQNTAPQQQLIVEPQAIAPAESMDYDAKTYIRLETKNADGQVSGVLEIDLISFRERGVESRYLHVNTIGVGQDGGQSDTTISIDNEQDFLRFKEFISKLNWND